MITKAEKSKQLLDAEVNKISLYHINEAQAEIRKGNEKIKVLFSLLIEEINKHNAVIKRKVTSIRRQGTSD